ncbi:prepilin-type N-terminal cleavage/methylation domain-containing protein [Thermus thermophilus]|uniref:prepilin-type N-terminal cleavage/methylation domain-containing protein n=1 Tax=Thermus thermophilus TaxID=274 RepID=UPI003BAABA31
MGKSQGVTLLELLVTLAVLGIALTIAALNLRSLYDPLSDAVSRTEGYLKQVRAKAMATTSAYRVSVNGNRLEAAYAGTCRSPSFTPDPALQMELPQGVSAALTPGGAALCFTSRGLLMLLNGGSYTGEPILTLRDTPGRSKALKLLLGGGVVRQ